MTKWCLPFLSPPDLGRLLGGSHSGLLLLSRDCPPCRIVRCIVRRIHHAMPLHGNVREEREREEKMPNTFLY